MCQLPASLGEWHSFPLAGDHFKINHNWPKGQTQVGMTN